MNKTWFEEFKPLYKIFKTQREKIGTDYDEVWMELKAKNSENSDTQNFKVTNNKVDTLIHNLLEHLYQLDQDKLNILDKLNNK